MNDLEQPGKSAIPYPDRGKKVADEDKVPVISGKRKWLRFLGYSSAVFACVALLSAGTIMGIYSKNPIARSIMVNIVKHPIDTIVNRDPFVTYRPEEYLPGQHVVNVLFLGCDYDYEDRRPQAIKTNRGRSDAILIARVDLDNLSINLMSIPRDTAVNIPGRSGVHKINAAHAFGGPEMAMQTIQSTFGIKTDYYVTLHFDAFKKIVDEVGGVDVNVQKQLDYDDNWGNLHIHLKPGPQHLNGYKAMGYVRMRHSDSDMMRAQRQQEFLQSLRSQISSPSNFLKLPNALNALTDNIATNMSHEQMLTLAAFAKKVPRENIQLAILPVNEGPSYVYVKTTEAEKLIRKLFYGDDPLASVTVSGAERQRVASVNRDERRPMHRERRRHRTTKAESTTIIPDEAIVPDSSSTEKPSNEGEGGEKGSGGGTETGSDPKPDAPPMPTDPPNSGGTSNSPG